MESEKIYDEQRTRHKEKRYITNETRSNNDGQENFSEIEKLQQEYHALLVDTDVVEFMDAEDKICAVMKDMYDTIAEGLEFDMDFMEG